MIIITMSLIYLMIWFIQLIVLIFCIGMAIRIIQLQNYNPIVDIIHLSSMEEVVSNLSKLSPMLIYEKDYKLPKINFKDDIGLTETNVLFRNHKKIEEFNKDWCRCINICRRDQISFDYLMFKHNIKFKRFSDNIKKIISKWIKHINPINRKIV